jgi:hypothetical protein
MLSPGCGSWRCGEYGGALLDSAKAWKRSPGACAISNGAPSGTTGCQSTPQ